MKASVHIWNLTDRGAWFCLITSCVFAWLASDSFFSAFHSLGYHIPLNGSSKPASRFVVWIPQFFTQFVESMASTQIVTSTGPLQSCIFVSHFFRSELKHFFIVLFHHRHRSGVSHWPLVRIAQTPVGGRWWISTDVLAFTIKFWFDTRQDIGDLTWDELLDVLVWTIVVDQFEMVALTRRNRQAFTIKSEAALVDE